MKLTATARLQFLSCIIFIFAISISASAQAQSVLNKRYSKETHVYKLDKTQYYNLLKYGADIDSLEFFKTLVTTYKTDSIFDYSDLPFGHYLEIKAVENYMQYSTKSNSYFRISSFGVNRETWFVVANNKDELIADAKVSINDVVYPFVEDCGCYPIPVKKANGLLLVEKDGFYEYRNLNTAKQGRDKYATNKADYSRNFTPGIRIIPGYMVTNKPKYRLLDTVKLKAFLVNEAGRPWNGSVVIRLKNPNLPEPIHESEPQKPTTSGAFVYEFVIADTVQIDQDYTISIYNSSGKTLLKQMNIRVEDYELTDSDVYLAYPLRPKFYRGEKLAFWMSAKDVNKLPLMDVKIDIKLRIAQFYKTEERHFYIPDAWYTNLFDTTFMLNASGEHLLEILDSILPNGDFMLAAEVKFTNSKNKQEIRNFTFMYSANPHNYVLRFQRDSLEILYAFMGEEQPLENCVLEQYRNNKLIKSTKVNLPYKTKLDFETMRYQLLKNEVVLGELRLPDQVTNLIKMEGERTHDSIKIHLKNDIGVTVNYRIFKKTEQVFGGRGKSLNFKIEDKSLDSYHIIYSTFWHGAFYIWEGDFHISEKELSVSIDQKPAIYPGEKVQVKITVKDYKNRGVKGVNLTAYAVNMKFDNIPMPNLPYFGRVHHGLLSTFTATNSAAFRSGSFAIKHKHLAKFNLPETPYYNFAFNANGIGIFEDSIKSTWAEFSPYVFNGSFDAIYTVYLNNRPVYLYGVTRDMPLTAKVKPGKYTVKLRTRNNLYTLKNIELKPGLRTLLNLNTGFAQANKNVSRTQIDSVPYVKIEKDNLRKYFLYMRANFGSNLFLEQDSLVTTYYENLRIEYARIIQTEQNWIKLGPFKKGMINVTNTQTDSAYSFYFEPGYYYYFNRDTLKVAKPDLVPDPFGNFYFGEKYATWNFNEHALKAPKLRKDVVEQKTTQEIKEVTETAINIDNPARSRQLKPAYPTGVKGEDRCLLNVRNHTEKAIKWVLIYNPEKLEQSAAWYNYLPANTYFFEGNYQMTVLFTDSTYISESVATQNYGQNYFQLYKDQLQAYDSAFIYLRESEIAELNKAPLEEFRYAPETIKKYHVSYATAQDSKIQGYILNYKNYPVNHAVLFLENKGKFVAGAITNIDGYFEMPTVKPGLYTLKIRPSIYDAWEIRNVLVQSKRVTKILVQQEMPVEDWKLNEIELYNDPIMGGYTQNNYTSEEIVNLPIRGTSGIAAITIEAGKSSQIRSRDSRSGTNQVFIDGVKVRGDVNLPREAIAQQEVITGGLPANYGDISGGIIYSQVGYSGNSSQIPKAYSEFMYSEGDANFSLLPLKADAQTNGIRKEFRDYAFWQPNLFTNKEGEAFFTVKFPDNITQWKTIVPAMNYKKQTGMGTFITQSYKPLSAVMALPYYLVENDKLTIEGNILNYLEDSIAVKYWLTLNADTLFSKHANVLGFKKQPWDIELSSGFQTLTFGILEGSGYKDGEQRTLNVYPNGVPQTTGIKWQTGKDSSHVFYPNPKLTSRGIFITNNNLDVFKMEIAELKSYRYGCNEQTASKLTALLLEKKMTTLQGEKFKGERDLNKSIRMLERHQNKDGSYGWWGKSSVNIFITTYVIKALNSAVAEGYRTQSHMKAAAYLNAELPKMKPSDLLESLDALSAIPYPTDYNKYLTRLDSLHLTYVDALLHTRIKQRLGKPVELGFILDSVQTTKNGSFWGEDLFNIKTNKWRTSMLAYEILYAAQGHDSLLTTVRNYFLGQKPAQRNTLERASMLSQFMDEFLENNSFEKEVKGKVLVNNREIEKFPFSKTYGNADTVKISVSGKSIQVYEYSSLLSENPEGLDSVITINTYFVQNKKRTDTLVWNRAVEMIVEVEVTKASEYILLEIPIPASCSYDPNATATNNANEIYREQFRDMTSIACAKLRPGKHKFVISLLPRFKGTFNVLPAQAGNMYFPVLKNYSKPKVIKVE